MTYRIERTIEGARVVFALSGEINAAHVATLRTLVEREATQHIQLDLRDITIADRDAVRFLAHAAASGAELLNCPEYVLRWVAAESGADADRHEP